MKDKDKILETLNREFPDAIIKIILDMKNNDRIRISEKNIKTVEYLEIKFFKNEIILVDLLFNKQCHEVENIQKYITTYYVYKSLNYYTTINLPNFSN